MEDFDMCRFKMALLGDQPKIELSTKVMCSNQFRVDFNNWLLNRFGVTNGLLRLSRDTIDYSSFGKMKSLTFKWKDEEVTWPIGERDLSEKEFRDQYLCDFSNFSFSGLEG